MAKFTREELLESMMVSVDHFKVFEDAVKQCQKKMLLISFAGWYNETYIHVSDDPIEKDQIDEYLKWQ